MNIGSPFYMSPEGFLNNRYSLKTDVWAFGVVVYELLHGKTPFQHCLNDLQLRNCMSQQISVDIIRPDISADLK
jgi:serine/threonine protein kinase